MAGYNGLKHYFKECTLTKRMTGISVPTFFISSLDDPLYGPHVVPKEITNDNVLLAVTEKGGHICYF